ncbi:hypothetical protein K1719_033759 [Acacia pycnantha]|nr:hypothetical protein K1719_033759 [Acacia pycnantha]
MHSSLHSLSSQPPPMLAPFPAMPFNLRFWGLRREAFGLTSLKRYDAHQRFQLSRRRVPMKVSASWFHNLGLPTLFDYVLLIIGAGVGVLGAALHAVQKGLKTAIVEGDVMGGTFLGLQVSGGGYDGQAVADHANNLDSKIRDNLTNSLKALEVDILTGFGTILQPHKVRVGSSNNIVTAKDIIIATVSVPYVPKGIEVYGKTVITSDHTLKLEFVPDWIAIVGSGYIGLEFSDVYTALGTEKNDFHYQIVYFFMISNNARNIVSSFAKRSLCRGNIVRDNGTLLVTFIEVLDQLMPGFDPEISKPLFLHITPARDGKPVIIELTDAKTKELKDILEVDAALIATGRAPFTSGLGLENIDVTIHRGFVPLDERMRVIDTYGNLVFPHLYCIGDANGKLMLAHAASAQGISVVEQITGRDHLLNH